MITIRNASGAVLTHFDNNVPEGNPYFEPEMTENMESLVSSFSFSVPLQLEDTDYLVGLNQVLAKDKDDDLRMFVITDVYEDWNTTNGTIRVEAEDISITEMNSIIVPPINVNSFEAALRAIFNKTGWSYELTANPSTTDRALFVLDGYTNMRDALVKLRDVYGCQYKFMAQEDAYGKVTRVVKVFKNRGNNTGKYFYYDRDLTNIERDISHTNIKTAAYITYKDAAGKVHNLLNWLPNHPIDGYTKDYSSALVVNDAAHIHWDDPEVYRVYLHESDLQDPYQAFQEGVEALGKLSEPMYTYKMNVILLQNLIGWEGEDIHLGDTIWAKERVGDRELGLEAQVVEYIYHEDDPTQDSVTFSNYKEIDTTDAKDLSNRIYFAYANSADGTLDFSTTDSANKLYMGVYTSDVGTQTTDPSVYNWTRIKGEDGAVAPTLQLNATSQIMKFKADNTVDGAQTITFEAVVQYMAQDSVVWKAVPFIGNTAQADITLTGTGLSRTLTSAQWNKNWTRVSVTVSANGLSDVVSVTKVSDGASGAAGESSITGFLSNEAVTFAANSVGTVSDYSTGKGTFIVYDGLKPVTNGVVYTLQSSTGITVVINPTTGDYVPDKMTTNMAQAVFTASYKGVVITKSVTFSKSIAGANGTNGTDGKDGTNGTDGNTTYIAYADSADGKTGFSTTDSVNKSYVGMYTGKPSDGQPTDPTKYKWSLFKGSSATNFSITSDSTIMKFDSSGNIKAGQLITFNAIRQVITEPITWTAIPYVDTTAQPQIILGGTSETTKTLAGSQWGYGVTSIKVKAECGEYEDTTTIMRLQDGAKGENGTAAYTHLAYANSADGKTDFSLTYPTTNPPKYLGVYVGNAETAPTDPTKYVWMVFKGADGSDGSDGVGITSTKVTYQASSSGTTVPSGTWLETIPTVSANQYLWTRTSLTYSNGSVVHSYSVGKMGANGTNGTNGTDGKDGVGVSKTEITYQASSSGTTVPTGTWSVSIPTVAANQYLWTRTVLTYTNSTTSTGYSIGKMGANGTNGKDGTDGLSSYVHVAYASSSDGVTDFTTVYPNPSKPGFIPSYLGTLVNHTEAASTKPSDYTWVKSRGDAGENGIVGILTNEAQQLAANSGGTITDYTPAKGTFQIFEGTTLVTNGVTYSMTDADGGTATINASSGAYAVTFVAKDVTNFVFKAVYKGLTILKTFCISKSKQGVQGVQGVQGLMGIAFYSPTAPVGQGVKEGATWFKTVSATDDTILSINKFKNGNWIETSLASGALNVESLSALSANLGDVTTGSLTGVTITSSQFISPFDTQTSETVPRRIKGTSTWKNGQMYNTFNFLDSSGTNVGRGYFISGNDRLFYRELDYSVAAGRITNDWVLNQEGFSSVHYAPYSGSDSYTREREVSVTSSGIRLKGGISGTRALDPRSSVWISSNMFDKHGIEPPVTYQSGEVAIGGIDNQLSNPSGAWQVQRYEAKIDSELPVVSAGQGLFWADKTVTSKLKRGSSFTIGYNSGLMGRYFDTDSQSASVEGDREDYRWQITPTMLQNIQFITGVQNYGDGKKSAISSWMSPADGKVQLSFPDPRSASAGVWYSGNSSYPFGTSSDFKTITYNGFDGGFEATAKVWWMVTMYVKCQVEIVPSGENHYTYIHLNVNGAQTLSTHTVWGGIPYQQEAVTSGILQFSVGDKLTTYLESNLGSKGRKFIGGMTRLEMIPFMRREYKTFDGSNVAS